MNAMRLRPVNWKAASDAAVQLSGSRRALSAQALSLAALYTADFDTASSRLRQASRLEPFSPQHEFRKALCLARFGDHERASATLEKLKASLPDAPLVDYVRALLALRAGRPEQARAITGTLETAHPQFIPGKFLRAEAQLITASRPSAIEKYLVALPSGTKWDPLWADLLIKLVFLHPQEGPTQARKHLEKKVSQNSPERALVHKALSWVSASMEELSQRLPAESAGSPSEALILECIVERLNQVNSQDAIRTLAALRRLHPERRALRCIYDAFLTHLASELSASGRQQEALSLVEQCLREQPQDLIYHQNRAALFTLLRESIPYHESWAALNRHQYRLVLFGALDAFTLSQIAKTHRLFSQQARGGRGARGIFRYVEEEEGGKPRMVTNVDEIASDPDVLRQWIHHTAAELVFRHTAIGVTGERLLLNSRDRDEALARTQSLATFADSLAILVPEEGAAIAKFLALRWRKMAATVHTRYEGLEEQPRRPVATDPEDREDPKTREQASTADTDIELDRLKQQHVEVLGDLSLICLQWRPQFAHLWVGEELLEFVHAEAAFLDEAWIYDLESRPGYETPYAVQVFAHHMRTVAGVEKKVLLTPAQRKSVVDSLVAEVLREMANSIYSGYSGTQKESAMRAIPYINRARTLRPADPEIEFTAARILVLGEFFDEARMALERFRRVVKPESARLIEEAEKIAEVLRERRKEGKMGEKLDRSVEPDAVEENRDFRIAELERDLDRSPGSWRLYEEVVQELALAGRFEEGVEWADRGVARCLSRSEQMNARGLAIGARGMKKLSEASPRAARLYAAGAHEPARKAIEAIAETNRLDYTLLYILGRCQLAGGMPDAALESFKAAAGLCERQLHKTVLQRLTGNIDNAYLAVAHSAINTALQESSAAEALEEAIPVFSRLRDPASWLVDFARIFFTSALNRAGSSLPPLTVPRITLDVPWQEPLTKALALQDDADRVLALCDIAAATHPASARAAMALVERTRTLKRQIAGVEALNHAGRLVRGRRFDEVLAYLDQLDLAIATEPRLLRIRVLALLGLRRFDNADTVIEQIGEGGSAEVREFVQQYPALSFRQRIAAAQQFLRDLKPQEAESVLRGARPINPKDRADLAYCKAFASALDGYDLRRKGRDTEARLRFLAALGLIEPHLNGTTGDAGRHIVELSDRLEKEIESYAGG
jgi:hypothetical protein